MLAEQRFEGVQVSGCESLQQFHPPLSILTYRILALLVTVISVRCYVPERPAWSENAVKKRTEKRESKEELGPEYDLSQLKGGIRGKYAAKAVSASKLKGKQRRRRKAKIIIDPITGLAVLTAGPGAPKLTSEQVNEMLSDFP
jgi:hypothetical protein